MLQSKNKLNKMQTVISITVRMLDRWLPYKIKYEQIPGLAVGILYKNRLVYNKGFGFVNLKSKIPINQNTAFRIASISKIFTTVSILQLATQKKLNLDDRVSQYFPWFLAKKGKLTSKNIKIRDLLSHRSGIYRDGTTPHWSTDKFPSISKIKKEFSEDSLIFKNGTNFKYSNFGYLILGEIIEVTSGMSYENYVKKEIIDRLKMKNTYPDYDPKIKNLATGYGRLIDGHQRKPFRFYKTNAYAPATGFISTISDLALLINALEAEDNLLGISKVFKMEMFKERIITSKKDTTSYCFGLEETKVNGHILYGHSGGFVGYITMLNFDPKYKIGAITLSNSLNSSVSDINIGIFEYLYECLKNHSNLDHNFTEYEGIYRDNWSDDLVASIGSRLIVFSPESSKPLFGASYLNPTKKTGVFVISGETDNHFGPYGELAKFDHVKGIMRYGAAIGKKIA